MSEHLFVRKEVCRNSVRKRSHVTHPAMCLGHYSLHQERCCWRRQMVETTPLFKLATFEKNSYESLTINFVHYRPIAIDCITWLLLPKTEFSFIRLY